MIRFATLDDKPRLIEMAVRFLLETEYGRMFDDRATPAMIDKLITNVLSLGAIVVAEIEELHGNIAGSAPLESRFKLVGMLAIVALPHPLTGGIYAEEIAWWVEPEHRHGTLGPKMLRSAEDWATRNGAKMCKMVAPAGSQVGAFYEHIGYRAVETAYIKRI